MRIAIIADFAQPSGGSQAVAILSALALRARGIAVSYIVAVAGDHDPRLDAAGVEVVSLGLDDVWERSALKGAVTGIWNREAARRLGDAVAALPPGPVVLHLHQWTRSLSPSAFPVLLGSGHPVAVTLHDYFIACPNGVYYRFDQDAPCTLVPLSPACLRAPCDPRSSLHKAVRVLRSAATRLALRGKAFDIVHVSDRARDTLAPFLPPGLRQHRIDNPVEAASGPPARIRPDAKLAYIGRLTREKGADLVAAAAHEAGMPVMFIGEGPAEAEIRRINPAAEMLGWRSRAELDPLMAGGIRAVAAPSRWYETGPLTIYEALAAGLPAIASDRSGAAEKVEHGRTGFVVAPEIGPLAGAFRQLADPALVNRMGAAAHAAYWASPPSAASHAEALVGLYGAMLRRQNGT
jgi:glycosyltransferase involved in cell wall biosynthesis